MILTYIFVTLIYLNLLLIVVSLSHSLLSFKSLNVFLFVCFFSLRACNLENMNGFLKNWRNIFSVVSFFKRSISILFANFSPDTVILALFLLLLWCSHQNLNHHQWVCQGYRHKEEALKERNNYLLSIFWLRMFCGTLLLTFWKHRNDMKSL